MDDAVLDGRYRILQKLGEGSMGEVYLVEHLALGRREALKILRPVFAGKPEFVSRFRREARATNRVQHPNIVAVYDFGRLADGRFFLSMEYVDGQRVDSLLHAHGRLSPRHAVDLLAQLAEAIEHAHACGVLHRDLKPENLMLLERRQKPDLLKVLDFGLAKITTPEDQDSVEQTRRGTVFGTVDYLAPERIRGEDPDPRGDLYAVGCIAYELLTGGTVFSGTTVQILHLHLTATPPPPSARAPAGSIPSELDDIVMRLLAKSPADRFASGGELWAALAPLAGTPARRSHHSVPKMLDFGAESTEVRSDDIGGAPTMNVYDEARRAGYWQLVVEAAEELLNVGYEDVQVVVGIADVKQLWAEVAAHRTELDELDRALGEIEQSARAQEASLRFALAELRFQRDSARARGDAMPPELDFQLGELDRRLRQVTVERDAKVRDVTDRAVAVTAAQARVEERLDPAVRRLERLVAAALARAPASQHGAHVSEQLEQARRARDGDGQSP